jgi:hypothetical protein
MNEARSVRPLFVIPAKAGAEDDRRSIQTDFEPVSIADWIPAFAGMTVSA